MGDWGIVANVISDSALRIGAKVSLLQVAGSVDSARCVGLSISGRRIEKWIQLKRLGDFRPSFRVDHHGRFDTRDDAQKVANNLSRGGRSDD